MTRVAEKRIEFSDESAGAGGDPIAISVDATSRVQSRGRALAQSAEDILRFYTALMGDAPYAAAAIALIENDLPGGHSPAYFALVNEPPPPVTPTWREDPAAFIGFPDFFLAHELAHQWWGQAIGWKNYHEQWLAEGFAQYFAAMYAQKTRGERVFLDMLRQFHRWSIDQSPQGPVYLGIPAGPPEVGPARVPRARLQQGRRRTPHAAPAAGRRNVFQGDQALLRGSPLPEGGNGGFGAGDGDCLRPRARPVLRALDLQRGRYRVSPIARPSPRRA